MLDIESSWKEASELVEQGDMDAALLIFQQLVEQGERAAITQVAHIYEIQSFDNGAGADLAIKWYQDALRAGSDSKAHVGLGKILMRTDTEFSNIKKAFWHFLQASKEGEMGALFALGYMYKMGLGTEKDIQKAMALFELAANMGHAIALRSLGYLYIKNGKFFRGIFMIARSIYRIFAIGLTSGASDERLTV